MSHSKNDFSFFGGMCRIRIHPARSQFDALVHLINPQTSKPYTHYDILSDLQSRNLQYPFLGPFIAAQTKWLEARGKSSSMQTFTLSCRGKTKEAAFARAKKELLPALETLAKILYRPMWDIQLSTGDLTVRQFVEFFSNELFSDAAPSSRTQMLSALQHELLPIFGEEKLCALTAQKQKMLLKRVNRVLNQKAYKASWRSYVKRAYIAFMYSIESFGGKIQSSPQLMSQLLETKQTESSTILKSFRPNRLDTAERERFFQILSEPQNLQILFWVALHYSGMEFNEIATATFGEVRELIFPAGSCYTFLVHRQMRKKDKRYSTIGVQNDEFPFFKFRNIVFSPWVADVLRRYVAFLKAQQISPAALSAMRFSENADGTFSTPEDMANQILTILLESGIHETELPRTDSHGQIKTSIYPVTTSILAGDAKYIAQNVCGCDAIMLHAMFGLACTETDEESYLALLSNRYAVARYHRLRRFSPYSSSDASGTLLPAKITNTASTAQLVSIESDYAVSL